MGRRRKRNSDERSASRQRSSTPPPPSDQSDHRLADRLEATSGALTNDEVERVLGRAAEIDSGLDTDATVDVAALIAAAREVGLSEASVRRAVAEVRAGEEEPDGFLARLLVGDEVVEFDMVGQGADNAGKILDGWMRNAEGLRPARVEGATVRWQPDRRWATRVRMGLGREASGMRLDGPSRISHSIVDVGESESLVAVRADTELVRQGATAALGGTAVVASAAAVPLLALTDGAAETALILGGVGIGAGGIASGIVLGTRMYVRELRQAMRRPLDAVSRAEPIRETAQIVDAVVDRLSRIRRRSKDQPKRRDGSTPR